MPLLFKLWEALRGLILNKKNRHLSIRQAVFLFRQWEQPGMSDNGISKKFVGCHRFISTCDN